jgi:hypothetical protein
MFPLSPIASLQGSPMDGPVAPEPPAPMALPPPMAQQPRGGGVRDILMQMAPMVLSAFSARKNPRGSAALLNGVVKGQQQAARERFDREQQQTKRRDAIADFMRQVAVDAQQFTTPEEVAQYLDFAETIARQIDPTMPAGTMRRTIPVSSTRMADAASKKTQAEAVKKITELKSLYGENFDTVSETAAVTWKGKETPVKAILALAELNLTKEGLPVSTQKPVPPVKPEAKTDYGDFLVRFAASKGTTVDKLTAAQELEAKKLWGQADDRPVDPNTAILKAIAVQNAQAAQANKPALPPRVQTQVAAKTRAFDSMPLVKRTQTMAEAVSFVDNMKPTTTNPLDDQALVYMFAKAMDPDSVVREGEYKTVQTYAQSWVQAFGKSVEQAIAGTGFLSQSARENMKATIRAKFAAARGQYDNVRRSYASQINRLTGAQDGDDYLTDFGGAFPQQQGGAAAAPTQTPVKVGDIRYKADGTKYKITGFTPDGKPIGTVVK